jgi:antitoxin PrlF
MARHEFAARINGKGQIKLPREVREHLRLAAGDRVEFVIEPGAGVRLVPLTRSALTLFGILRRPGMPSPTLAELDDAVSEALARDDERIHKGR